MCCDMGRLFSTRVFYDVAFFVIIIILLLNIIFGIIIDTFGQLREEAAEKSHIMANYCFVCGIAKEVFDLRVSLADAKLTAGTLPSDFNTHIKNEHNMWDYIFFLIYLKNKDPNEYTGIERYVLSHRNYCISLCYSRNL